MAWDSLHSDTTSAAARDAGADPDVTPHDDPPPPRAPVAGDREFVLRIGVVPAIDPTPWPDRYERLEELGRGGMGVVHLARDRQLDRLVAVKVVHPEFAASGRARTEAETAARLHHPNIVAIWEVFALGSRLGLVLEFVSGGSLARHLARGPLAPQRAARLVAELAAAMDAAHRAGVIHRDLKPANVLLQIEDGLQSAIPKIADFGLAKRAEVDGSATITGQVLGTPSYMSPEQVRGAREVGKATDIYALGAILYECVTARPPFRAASTAETLEQVLNREPAPPRQLNPAVPRDLEAACLKCLDKSPERRYATAAALADDLRRFLAGQPTLARPIGLWGRALKASRRRPAVAALLAVSACALIGGGLGVIAHNASLANALTRAENGEAAARRQQALAQTNYQSARETLERMIARVEARHGDGTTRLKELRRDQQQDALAFFETIAAQTDVADPETEFDAARAHYEAGRLQLTLGRLTESATHFNSSISTLRRLTLDHPDEARFTAALAKSLNGLGTWHLSANRYVEAIAYHSDALALRIAVAKRATDAVERKRELSDGYYRLGSAEVMARRFEPAESHLKTAIRIRSALVNDAADTRALADMRVNLSLILQQAGPARRTEAEMLAENAEADLDALVRADPLDAGTAIALARLRTNRGYALSQDMRRIDEAVDRLGPSVASLDALLKREPNSAEIRTMLRDCCGARAQFREAAGDFAAAVPEWERVVALDESPTQRIFLAWARARAGDHMKANVEIHDLARTGKLTSPELYTLALVGVAAAGVVAGDPARSPSEKTDLTNQYGAQAVSFLRQSMLALESAEKRDEFRSGLATAKELEPIRNRLDFRALQKIR